MFNLVPYQFVLETFLLDLCPSGNLFHFIYIGIPISWIPFTPLSYLFLCLVKSVFQ